MRPVTTVLALMLVVAALGACRGPELRDTGYLSDYSKLQVESPDRLVYINPDIAERSYHAFLIEPVSVNLEEEREADFTAEELAEIAEYFQQAWVAVLAERFEVVTEPGPGVARLRVALTDITTSIGLMNVIPHTRVTGVGRGGAAIEGELVDSTTGVQLAAVVRRAEQGVFDGGGMTKMSDAKRTIDEWAEQFREGVLESRYVEEETPPSDP